MILSFSYPFKSVWHSVIQSDLSVYHKKLPEEEIETYGTKSTSQRFLPSSQVQAVQPQRELPKKWNCLHFKVGIWSADS